MHAFHLKKKNISFKQFDPVKFYFSNKSNLTYFHYKLASFMAYFIITNNDYRSPCDGADGGGSDGGGGW